MKFQTNTFASTVFLVIICTKAQRSEVPKRYGSLKQKLKNKNHTVTNSALKNRGIETNTIKKYLDTNRKQKLENSAVLNDAVNNTYSIEENTNKNSNDLVISSNQVIEKNTVKEHPNTSDRANYSNKLDSSKTDKLLYYVTEICNVFLLTILLGGVLVFFLAWDERKQFNRVNKVKITLENLNFRAQMQSGVTSTEECSICYESYERGEFYGVLRKCGHKFHLKCLQKWVYHQQCDVTIAGRSDVTCPLCRTSIVK